MVLAGRRGRATGPCHAEGVGLEGALPPGPRLPRADRQSGAAVVLGSDPGEERRGGENRVNGVSRLGAVIMRLEPLCETFGELGRLQAVRERGRSSRPEALAGVPDADPIE